MSITMLFLLSIEMQSISSNRYLKSLDLSVNVLWWHELRAEKSIKARDNEKQGEIE